MAENQQASQAQAEQQQQNILARMLKGLMDFFRRLFSRKGRGAGQGGAEAGGEGGQARQHVGAGPGEKGREKAPQDPEMGQAPSAARENDITDAEWSEIPGEGSKGLGHDRGAEAQRMLLDAAKTGGSNPRSGLLGVDAPGVKASQIVAEGASLSDAHRKEMAEMVLGEHANAMRARIEPGVTSSNSKHSYDFNAPYKVNMDLIEERLRWVIRDPNKGIGPEDVKDAYFGALVMGKLQSLKAGDSIALTENDYDSQMSQYVGEIEEKLKDFTPVEASKPEVVASLYNKLVERMEGSYVNIADANGVDPDVAKAGFKERVMGEPAGAEPPSRKTAAMSM